MTLSPPEASSGQAVSAPRYGTVAKLGLLTSLYFAQGLPFGFFTQSLPVMLRKESFSLGAIGLSSLLAMPWALKFLWAPLVDRHYSARLGPRRSWILPLQLAAFLILLALAALEARSIAALMGAVFLLNLVAATQDIATDGLAVDMVAPSERGFANGVQVAGYRVGMIVGGGVLLILYDRLGARMTFLAMAGLIVLSSAPIAFTRESPRGRTSPEPARSAPDVAAPLPHFVRRPFALRLLALLVLYKAGDAFATGMLRPFLVDRGLSLADIGWLLGTVGFVAGLLGALLGGSLVNRVGRSARSAAAAQEVVGRSARSAAAAQEVVGRKRALIMFGLLQAASVGGYAYAAAIAPSLHLLYVLCALEHLVSGMATAALFTCMMDWCSRESSATDYTVQASSVVVATGLASMLSGFSAQSLGYFAHFALATALAAAGVVVAGSWFPSEASARRVRGEREEPTCA
jgi:MFS family permease